MSTAFHLRPFTPDDYPALLQIGRFARPGMPMTEERLRWQDENRDPKLLQGRIIAELAGTDTVVGLASWGQAIGMFHPQKFRFWMAVHPEQRRQGIGDALYTAVREAITPFDPLALRTFGRENDSETLSFLAKRGFVEEMRHWENHLHLTDFHPERFVGVEERLNAEGIVIRTFTEIDAESGGRQRLYETTNTIDEDVPAPEAHTPPTFEQWQRQYIDEPNFLPDGYFIAVDTATGEFVGVSTLSRLPESDHLQTGLTGVRREYRRRGIALALKLRATHYALAVGASVIRTGNATTNTGMLALNELLGYQKQPAWINFVQHLKPPFPP